VQVIGYTGRVLRFVRIATGDLTVFFSIGSDKTIYSAVFFLEQNDPTQAVLCEHTHKLQTFT